MAELKALLESKRPPGNDLGRINALVSSREET
jgi:hypothetical protein